MPSNNKNARGECSTKTLPELVRIISSQKNKFYAVLLGAGASLSSGMPLGSNCLRYWKRLLWSSQLGVPPDTDISDIELTEWLENNGHCPPAFEEYGYYFQQCHPAPEARQGAFDHWVERAVPSAGYKCLAKLAARRRIRCVWTTNFDRLFPRAWELISAELETSVKILEVGLDCVERIQASETDDSLVYLQLHGDCRYDSLLNTPEELQVMEPMFREDLEIRANHCSLIVSGYSGCDVSVMSALADAGAKRTKRTSLYWCGVEDEPDPNISKVLQAWSKQPGFSAYYVKNSPFDELMGALSSIWGEADSLPQQATEARPKRSPAVGRRSVVLSSVGMFSLAVLYWLGFGSLKPGEVQDASVALTHLNATDISAGEGVLSSLSVEAQRFLDWYATDGENAGDAGIPSLCCERIRILKDNLAGQFPSAHIYMALSEESGSPERFDMKLPEQFEVSLDDGGDAILVIDCHGGFDQQAPYLCIPSEESPAASAGRLVYRLDPGVIASVERRGYQGPYYFALVLYRADQPPPNAKLHFRKEKS